MIETKQEYLDCDAYETFATRKFCEEMNKLGFTQLFIKIIYEDLEKSCTFGENVDFFKFTYKLYDYLIKTRSYIEENISRDLLIYLLEQHKNKLLKNY